MFAKLKTIFHEHSLLITKEDENTLYLEVDNQIKLSFFRYSYKLVEPLVQSEHFPLASILDIACMKLAALRQRAVLKDYVDLYYIFQRYDLSMVLNACQEKYPNVDKNVFLRALIYTSDIENQRIIFKNEHRIALSQIEGFLQKLVRDYYSIS